jgi:uncharacterized protein (DUF433 family)
LIGLPRPGSHAAVAEGEMEGGHEEEFQDRRGDRSPEDRHSHRVLDLVAGFGEPKTKSPSLLGAVSGKISGMEPTTTAQPPKSQDEPSAFPVVTEHIGVRPGYCGGEPHILGHRIKVRHVAVWHERMGMTPTQIAATYPTITLSQVHAALAYYYDHRDEIQAAIEEERDFIEEQKAKTPPSKLQKILGARMAADAPDDPPPPR